MSTQEQDTEVVITHRCIRCRAEIGFNGTLTPGCSIYFNNTSISLWCKECGTKDA